jgi:23S rRNA (uracil1939-C5)-methyltransferase
MTDYQLNCPHFGVCGGCVTNTRNLDEKRAALEFETAPIIDAAGAGRRRVTWHKLGKTFGYSKARSHELVEVTECQVLDPRLLAALPLAKTVMDIMGDGDCAITLAANGLDFDVRTDSPVNNKQRSSLLILPSEITRLSVNQQLVVQQKPIVVGIAGFPVPLPHGAFLQATKAGEKILQELVLNNLGKSKKVIDLFAGLGTFTLAMAKTMRVHAVEIHEPSLQALDHAVRHSEGLKPITTEVRDLYRKPFFAKDLNEFDAIVIDPPRAGASKQFAEIVKSKVKRVISVSCNPDTFYKDAYLLKEAGFKTESITPVDQFAFSKHIELVGVFTR